MNKETTKHLIKELTQRIKNVKCEELSINDSKIIKQPSIDTKYITEKNYKELVGLYNYMKAQESLDLTAIERFVDVNKIRFPYLHKCNESIYDFASTLLCSGPQFIAREMTRQGREIDYINNNIIKNS